MITNKYDITIIGAGPVGIYAAFYAAMKKLKVKIIDSNPNLGGQLQAIYPEKYIYDVPGFDKILAKDLIKNLEKQMNSVDESIEIVLNETVDYVRKSNDILEICTDKVCHYTKTVLITAGRGAFQPRLLGLDNEEKYQNIHYAVNDIKQFIDKKVIIFGGGDSAVDWANMLNGYAKEVTIVHRREKFRAHELSVDKMKSSLVNVLTSYVISAIDYNNNKINKIYLQSTNNKKDLEIEVDELIVLFGFLSSLGHIETWNLKMENKALAVNTFKQTNIKGIYAAGDACNYEGKVKMITSGFGEAVIAVSSAYDYINPKNKV